MTQVNARDLLALSRMIKYSIKAHGVDSPFTQDYVAQYERLSKRLEAQANESVHKAFAGES